MSRYTKQAIAARRYFDGWARRYDLDLQRYDYALPNVIFEMARSRLDQKIIPISMLDIGIGTGLTSAPFKQMTRPIHITGLDISDRMLKICQEKQIADAVFQTDISSEVLPCPDVSFDLVIAAGVLEYIDDPAYALSEIRRVLKPQGIAILTYETPQNLPLYNKSGFFTGVTERTAQRITVQRCRRHGLWGLWYKFYKKYLHAPEKIRALYESHALTLQHHQNIEAYRWSDDHIVMHDVIMLSKTESSHAI